MMRAARLLSLILAAGICMASTACVQGTGMNLLPKEPTAVPPGGFLDTFDGDAIDAAAWQVATWAEHGGQTGMERCYTKDGRLEMLFINDDGSFLSSAMQSRATFLYGRWEFSAKPSGVYGLLNSFYTIDWGAAGEGTKQEIDIEFLSKSFSGSAGQIHYAVHAEGRESFNTNPDVNLGFNPSAAFHVYGFDISPTRIQWLVDGLVLREYVYADGDITIDSPYQLKLNCWSSVNWIDGPPESGAVCTYLVDWIRFTPAH